MLKIEFPSENKELAKALAIALHAYGTGRAVDGIPAAFAAPFGRHVPDVADEQVAVDSPKELQGQVRDGQEPTINVDVAAADSDDDDGAGAPQAGSVDKKGVPFNAALCSNAKEPFYTSGARLGQWKKRKGVSDAEYDAWYTSALPGQAAASQTAPFTAAAFAPAHVTSSAPVGTPAVPQNGGELMRMVAEWQGAGRLTQQQVDDAYREVGVNIGMLFDPVNGAAHAARVYQALVAKVGA